MPGTRKSDSRTQRFFNSGVIAKPAAIFLWTAVYRQSRGKTPARAPGSITFVRNESCFLKALKKVRSFFAPPLSENKTSSLFMVKLYPDLQTVSRKRILQQKEGRLFRQPSFCC